MEKKKKRFNTKNLKLSTRITFSTIFGIIIPVVVIAAFTSIFINSLAKYFDFSTVVSNSYSIINQLQWDQTLSNIAEELISDEGDEKSLVEVKRLVVPLEKLGSIIYIEGDKKGEFYTTTSKDDVYSTAVKILREVDIRKNTNYFSDEGVVIVTHARAPEQTYSILIANNTYAVADIFEENYFHNFGVQFFGKTGIAILLIALVFVLSAVVLSFITSSKIIKPIKKLAEGANEISKGNLDYVIDYDSTNEIGVTVASFNKMTAQLKASLNYQQEIEDSRRQLVAGIAHDLRTPLTSVKGYVEGLMDGIADTPEKQERYLKTIYKSTTSMEKMLDELLTVSKLETGIALELHKININSFLEDCYTYMKGLLEQKNFDFTFKNNCSPDTCVMLDSDGFARVIRNILSNSVRYSKSGVKGRIEFSADQYKKNIIISIADNGIGMSAENMTKMFDIFYRADPARTRVSEGSGLGLYICKQIVELHGGKIWATGEEGAGMTIHISLDTVSADGDFAEENTNE